MKRKKPIEIQVWIAAEGSVSIRTYDGYFHTASAMIKPINCEGGRIVTMREVVTTTRASKRRRSG